MAMCRGVLKPSANSVAEKPGGRVIHGVETGDSSASGSGATGSQTQYQDQGQRFGRLVMGVIVRR